MLWVFKVNSLASAVGQAGAARTHPIADFYLRPVAQAVFESAIAIATKKDGLWFN